MNDLTPFLEQLIQLIKTYAPDFIKALFVLIVGFWIIRIFNRRFLKFMEKREVEPSLRGFVQTLLSTTLKILLIISVMSMVGIEMTSFIALIAAAGLAVGLALQGTLQNFAGGVIILILKPFRVGHFITAQGHSGTVKEIQVFNTILKTPDNKTIVIPNSPLATGSLINYSVEENRRCDFTFGIGYGDDIDKAKLLLKNLIDVDERFLQDPAPQIVVGELGDSSVNIIVRAWVKASDYWDVFFEYTEKVKKIFDKEGINIPFPQHDVHLYQQQ
ncbi:MAG: mechanosensitive ion channel [Bacteroidales bacterium]|jgi:small conductance mechanosensitive channel